MVFARTCVLAFLVALFWCTGSSAQQELTGSCYPGNVVAASCKERFDSCQSNQNVCVCSELQPCCGSDNRWFLRFGVGVILFGESAELRANDMIVPGASILISDETTFVFDIGYELSPFWTATFTCGVPPRLDLDGTGPFAGVSYGTTRYAPAILALQRHFYLNPRASIYVGAGVNYTLQYESRDGLVQNLDIENNAAVVLQLGAERRLNERWSMFADAKKVFYKTEAFGEFNGAAIRADVVVNPTALYFGLRRDF